MFPLNADSLKIVNKELSESNYRYPQVPGESDLLDCLASKHNTRIDNIVVSTTTKILFKSFIDSYLQKSDEVLLIEPIWSFYKEVLTTNSIKFHSVQLNQEMMLIKEDLLKVFQANKQIKLIVLNNPNNPTGKVFCKNELLILQEILIEKDIKLLVDEVFSDLIFDNNSNFISIKDLYDLDKIIVLNSASKNYGLPGLKISYMITSPETVKQVAHYLNRYGLIPPIFIQNIFRNEVESLEYHNQNLQTVKEKFQLIKKLVHRTSTLDLDISQAGLTLFPKLKVLPNDPEWHLTLLRDYKVSVIPGSAFGYADRIRICFAHLNEQKIKAGIEAIDNYLR